MKKIIEKFVLKGKSKTKKNAISNALSSIQSTVMKKFPDYLILKIEPCDLVIKDVKHKKNVEYFLFLKRQKEYFEVTLEITVEIKLIESN